MHWAETGCVVQRLLREIDIWKQLHHPNVLPLLGVLSGFMDDLGMVSPWCAHGDINTYLNVYRTTPTFKELAYRLVSLRNCR